MLAYAPRPESRRFQPSALFLILAAHAVAIVAVMTAKMEAVRDRFDPTEVISIPLPPEPEQAKPDPDIPKPAPSPPISSTDPIVPLPPLPAPIADPWPPQPLPQPDVGTGAGAEPQPTPMPIVRKGPRFATPVEDVRPPYPEAMRAQEKEAVLRLRLSIDERGRVVAVEPVGKAEPAFLAAARRHILKAWRYAPAMEGDRAIASTTVITLEFKLDS